MHGQAGLVPLMGLLGHLAPSDAEAVKAQAAAIKEFEVARDAISAQKLSSTTAEEPAAVSRLCSMIQSAAVLAPLILPPHTAASKP